MVLGQWCAGAYDFGDRKIFQNAASIVLFVPEVCRLRSATGHGCASRSTKRATGSSLSVISALSFAATLPSRGAALNVSRYLSARVSFRANHSRCGSALPGVGGNSLRGLALGSPGSADPALFYNSPANTWGTCYGTPHATLFAACAPEYQAQLKHVGLLREVPPTVCRRPRLPSIDKGIDLIACTRHGADISGKSHCGRNLQLLAEIWKNCVWGWTDTAAYVQNRRLS